MTSAQRPASGVPIVPEQLTRMRDLRALSREELAERTGRILFDRDRFAAIMSGQVPASPQAARSVWLALDAEPAQVIRGLPDGLARSRVPRWLRMNSGWYLDTGAVNSLRGELGWSTEQLADATARHWFSRDSVAKIERGERRPRARTLRAFCRILKCKPADLQAGAEPLPDGTSKARQELMDRNREMREWADAQDPPIPYRNEAGRIKYPDELRRRYTAHRAEQEGRELILDRAS